MVSLVLSIALPISARAGTDAQDGVQVDPNSSPAVEYALPLQDARGDVAGSTGGGRGSGDAAGDGPPAFGDGITAQPVARGRPADAGGKGTALGSADRTPTAGKGIAPGAADRTPIAGKQNGRRASPGAIGDTGGPAVLYALGGVAAVLFAGACVALALRRRHSAA